MNRLIITLMLALAFALSLAHLAHAQDAGPLTGQSNPPPALTTTPKAKPNHRQHRPAVKKKSTATDQSPNTPPAAAVTTTAQTSSGSPTTPLQVEDDQTIDGENGSTTTLKISYTSDGTTIKRTATEADCGCTFDLPDITDRNIVASIKNADDIKAKLTPQTVKDVAAQQQLANEKAKAEKKLANMEDNCTINPGSKEVVFKSGHWIVAKKENTDDSPDSGVDDDTGLTAIDTCMQNRINTLSASDDPASKKALNSVLTRYENNLLTLYGKVVTGAATPDETTRYTALHDYNQNTLLTDPTLKEKVINISLAYAANQKSALMSQINGVSSNPALAANLPPLAAQYTATLKFAKLATGGTEYAPGDTDAQRWSQIDQIEKYDLHDLSKAVTTAQKLAKSNPATTKGVTGDFTAALADSGSAGAAAVAQADAAYTAAGATVARVLRGSPATTLENRYAMTPPLISNVNSNLANTPAHFAVGTGQLAAASGIPGAPLTTPNTWANTVASPSFLQQGSTLPFNNSNTSGSIFRTTTTPTTYSAPTIYNGGGTSGFRS